MARVSDCHTRINYLAFQHLLAVVDPLKGYESLVCSLNRGARFFYNTRLAPFFTLANDWAGSLWTQINFLQVNQY